MGRVPEETIERIKEANDIVDIVGRYVQLRKRGKNYFGLCPFHQEDTPSFSVAPDKQIYHCFGCGKGGNVISFVMDYEKLNFPEALERLANNAGIELPKTSGGSRGDRKQQSAGPLYRANEFAMKVYERALRADEGAEALEYLRDRGYSEETLRAFRVGFAPDAWDTLVTWGPKNKIDLETLATAGLIKERSGRSGYYDRFRNRVMFPIQNTAGRVVAFGGRAMNPEDKAKYLNSPESPIYQKRKILYGLHQATDELRKAGEVMLVEGYTDLLRLWENGFRNVVAVSGTAFTEQHAKILGRYADRGILCYDSDSAGVQATLRAGSLLAQAGMEVRCMELPDGHDPDTFIREESPKAFTTLKEEASTLLRFRLARTAGELKDASAKARFIRETLDDIAEISDELIRNLQIKELAELVNADERQLHRELQQHKRRPRRTAENESAPVKSFRPENASGMERAQYELLRLLLTQDAELITYILEHISPDDFTHPLLRIVADHFITYLAEHDILHQEEATELFSEESVRDYETHIQVQQLVTGMLFELEAMNPMMNKEKMAKDCLRRLELGKVKEKIDQINSELRERDNGQEETFDLLKRRKEMEELRKQILEKYK